MPMRPSMSRLLQGARVQSAIAAMHAVDASARAATDEARAKRALYPHFSDHVNAPRGAGTPGVPATRRNPR